jgi:hypothetical protein
VTFLRNYKSEAYAQSLISDIRVIAWLERRLYPQPPKNGVHELLSIVGDWARVTGHAEIVIGRIITSGSPTYREQVLRAFHIGARTGGFSLAEVSVAQRSSPNHRESVTAAAYKAKPPE